MHWQDRALFTSLLALLLPVLSLVGCDEADRRANGEVPALLFAQRAPQEMVELIAAGEEAFHAAGCTACHSVQGTSSVGPSLAGIFGEPVELKSGQVVERDKAYLYRAITKPQAQTVAGYHPQLMPDYTHLDVKTRVAIVEYIRSLAPAEHRQAGEANASQDAPPGGTPTPQGKG